jgi:mannose-1-phosphate guanylyltransferase/mannose-6-phosphate isomerase
MLANAQTLRPFILCGGSGTRLWPLSTREMPKQFHALSGQHAMISETARRLPDGIGGLPIASVVAVAGVQWRDLLRQHLPEAGMLLEPFGRNSGPAVAAAALSASEDDLILILPADHHIGNVPAFHEALSRAVEAAATGALVAFGIHPKHAATGYGYIELETPADAASRMAPVVRFVEKPDAAKAQSFVDGGRHLWNAGIFLFKASAMLQELRCHAPEILDSIRQSLPCLGPLSDREERTFQRKAFGYAPSISIDYAIMEKAGNVTVVPVTMDWTDLGDFRALHAIRAPLGDSLLNGPAAETHSRGNLIYSTGPRIAVHGLEGIVVAASADGVLVSTLEGAADIRSAVEAASRTTAPNFNSLLATKARTYIRDHMLPCWGRTGWDSQKGGFVEALSADLQPHLAQPRRGRVAPRQVFTFATALKLGWDMDGVASRLVDLGLGFMDGAARSPGGGWAHVLGPDNVALDTRRDLYDHAFIALGSARAFEATGDERAERLAVEAFEFIDTTMRDGRHGYANPEIAPGAKHANPHMHLLEANLVWYEASADPSARTRIDYLCSLFETYMFDNVHGAVREVFAADWSQPHDHAHAPIEPGHCYEWAWLLSEVQRLTGRDTASWSRRLIGFADRQGRDAQGFSFDGVSCGGTAVVPTRRLWPQLERFRARLRFPETASPGEAERELERIFELYLTEDSPRWHDRLEADGSPSASSLPASMPYHFMTALGGL